MNKFTHNAKAILLSIGRVTEKIFCNLFIIFKFDYLLIYLERSGKKICIKKTFDRSFFNEGTSSLDSLYFSYLIQNCIRLKQFKNSFWKISVALPKEYFLICPKLLIQVEDHHKERQAIMHLQSTMHIDINIYEFFINNMQYNKHHKNNIYAIKKNLLQNVQSCFLNFNMLSSVIVFPEDTN